MEEPHSVCFEASNHEGWNLQVVNGNWESNEGLRV